MHTSYRSGCRIALVALLGSMALGAAAPPKKSAPSGPAPMTYLQCDLEKFTTFPRGGDPVSTPVSVTKGYGFRSSPLAVVDAITPNIPLQPLKVDDNVVEFRSSNTFEALVLYSSGKPDAERDEAVSFKATINRVTGSINVTFYPKYGPAEIAACKKSKDGPWCNYSPVSADLSGNCKKVVRRF